MTVVYIDEAFVLNFIVDYVLLLAAARLSPAGFSRPRLAAGAAAGGVYAVAANFFVFLAAIPAFLAAAALITLIAFGADGFYLRRTAMFVVFGAALAGLLTALKVQNIPAHVLIAAALAAYAVITLLFKGLSRFRGKSTHAVRVSVNGESREFTALGDTGNTLKDPYSGDPVLVADTGIFAGAFPESVFRELNSGRGALEIYERLGNPAFRLLRVGTAAGKSWLIAFRPDELTVDGRAERALVALSEISGGGARPFRAIIQIGKD